MCFPLEAVSAVRPGPPRFTFLAARVGVSAGAERLTTPFVAGHIVSCPRHAEACSMEAGSNLIIDDPPEARS